MNDSRPATESECLVANSWVPRHPDTTWAIQWNGDNTEAVQRMLNHGRPDNGIRVSVEDTSYGRRLRVSDIFGEYGTRSFFVSLHQFITKDGSVGLDPDEFLNRWVLSKDTREL